METIRQYMESLFVSLPNNEEVRKAKAHLLEMAEDKYLSLKDEGCTENEAVAKVIAEFGNLDELKEELGLSDNYENYSQNEKETRFLSLAEIKELIADYTASALLRGIGVMCFICCVVPCILLDHSMGDWSTVLMFGMIGLGIVLMIVQSAFKNRWDFVPVTRCAIDMATADYVKDVRRDNRIKLLTVKSLGVLMICMCFVPPIVLHGAMSGASLFLMIGGGVLLVVYANSVEGVYEMVLNINPENTVGRTYNDGSGRIIYDNKTVGALMSIYWPLIVCAYLSVSFLTFHWEITWIIFPIAGIANKFIQEAYGEKE